MQYQVPQFIDIEDKIFGPLTFKQFLYVAGGAAIAFIIWSVIPGFLSFPIAIAVLGFFLMAAFYKVNGQPFLNFVESFVRYSFSKKLYLWKKADKKPQKNKEEEQEEPKLQVPKLSNSKLREITWGLDVHEKLDESQSKNDNGLNLKV